MKATLTRSLLTAGALLVFAGSAHAQGDTVSENRIYMEKSLAELADYIDAKCGDFRREINFDDSAFDYGTNPTNGMPTPADRVFAGIYGIAAVCETGEDASARMRSKISSITIAPGGANTARLNGGVLEIRYDPQGDKPMGELRDIYSAQIDGI